MSERLIDFRSDTVTLPTPEMRHLMAEAEMGDDVYQDDPTVNALEEKAAALMGKEASLFVSSGTMGNLIACLVACRRGDEVIMGRQGHTFLHEAGGVSVLGGIAMNVIPNLPNGEFDDEDLRGALRSPEDVHQPISRMVIIENTQNSCGGTAISKEYTDKVAAFARKNQLFFHIDGARIFNAAVKLGLQAADLVQSADSVTFCLSKGLSCPVGSMLCGSEDFIHEARRARKILGGGMRQAGVLAAAGIYALDHMIDRLAEDHQLAELFAAGIAELPQFKLVKGSPQTNMVFVEVQPSSKLEVHDLVDALKDEGVLVGQSGENELRFVTHYGLDRSDVEACLAALKRLS